MKKILIVLMAFLMFSLSACSGDSGTASENNTKNTKEEVSKEDDGKVHIKFWYAWKDKIGENNENLVKKFNESQDKIVVESEYQGTYDELHSKVQAAYVAGNAPEVTENEIASMGVFARGGMTRDLTDFVDDDLKLDDFNKGLMGNSYVDGKLYGLPYLRSTPVLYKNVDMLKAAGLDPEGPRDFKELEEYTKALRKNDVYGLSLEIDPWIFEAFVDSNGGSLVAEDGVTPTFQEKPSVDVVSFWSKLKDEDLIKIPVGEKAEDNQRQDFTNKKIAMMFGSTSDVSYNLQIAKEKGFTLGVNFIPKGVKNSVPTGGCNLVMTNNLSKEKEKAAWEFMKWMTATEQTAYASKYTGYLPSRYSALETDLLKNLYKDYPQYKVAVDQLEYAVPRPMAEGVAEVLKLLKDKIEEVVINGEESPEDGLNDVAKSAKTILKK